MEIAIKKEQSAVLYFVTVVSFCLSTPFMSVSVPSSVLVFEKRWNQNNYALEQNGDIQRTILFKSCKK